MFQVGFGELVVVLVVALWVFGPERLPALARICGRWLGKTRQSYLAIKQEFQDELNKTTKQ
ncbi:Sec-independent protein translocase protein TatB [Candidatus Berkiella aquae]|uniref:Sec-independent protein translocase protein TatB n=1 Tax=Candidatus Berkiella aquae TaxID=295108 RepID=A0A0Q9Z0W4_9GAMM|nr:Sec-independent protein translocase protein TatB [Candidatus Berkiella aquae]MCS5712645.1 Sec-independent protein translocase protein TatB [Candidatus Berkiella aquae]